MINTRTRVERFEVVVVGGGQAGLAIGRELAARDADFVIVDKAERVGESWRRRWDSLRLFTPAAYSALPGMHFPAPAAHLPDKDDVANYLEQYAERFDLPLRLNTSITSLRRNGERYVLTTDNATLEADHVVVATGPFQRPRVPTLAARLSSDILQLHSSEYRNPLTLPPGPVLVVGAGNSGAQIAMEIARVRKVWLAGRDVGHLPRRWLGRDLFDWVWPIMQRFSVDTRVGRAMQARARNTDALIGITSRMLAASGVKRVGRVTEVRGGLPVCDGEVVTPSVIVWCTGYDTDYSWIDLPIFDAEGRVTHRRGVVENLPGLYFLGLRFQRRMSSALLGGVGADAAFLAEDIMQRCAVAEVM